MLHRQPVPEDVGELDLHLFAEGRHRRLWEVLGPQPLDAALMTGAGFRFAVWAPNAAAVRVVGDWNGWSGESLAPVAQTGLWSAVVSARVAQRYKLEITDTDGRVSWRADPMARQSEVPPADASVVPTTDLFGWGDEAWIERRGGVRSGELPLRIYEVHPGSWRDGITNWRDLAEQLGPYVGGLGFTHVELLGVAEHPFGGSWGYQVTGYYSPTARLGSPDDLRWFVDRMHAEGIGVIIDWVPAHFGRDEWALGRFDGTALYEHLDPRLGVHPDWDTYVFNYGRHEVRNFLVANALYWMSEFHVDGLRVDAVASMLYLDYSRAEGEWIPNRFGGRENLEAIDFITELNTVVAEEFPDVLMIAEESTSWPGVTNPVDDGGLGFSHKWNMGWMNDTLRYVGRDPIDRRYHHSELSFLMLYAHRERFVLPLSHDEVVHGKGSLLGKMPGDTEQRFATLRALLCWQWIMPGAPMVFMGTELAPWDEWDHAHELAWELLEHHHHRGVRDLVIELNRVAEEYPAMWRRDDDPGGYQWLDPNDAQHSTYSLIRWDLDGGQPLVCVANFTPVARDGFRVGVAHRGAWSVVLDSDAQRFGGSGAPIGDIRATATPWQGQAASLLIDLPPLAVVMLAASPPAGSQTNPGGRR